MIKRIRAAYEVLQAKKSLADPAKWKTRQVTSTMLVAAVWSITRLFGWEMPIDEDTLDGIAVGIISIVNVYFTYATTDKIGLPSEPDTDPKRPNTNS
jgi:hypothetical protein